MRGFGKSVDKSFARMVAMKRIATGVTSLASGCVLLYVAIMHGGAPTPLLALGLLILWGGGTWSLRDGLRLRRLL